MKSKRYILGFGTVKQKPLTSGAFEKVLIVFTTIGMNKIFEAWIKIGDQLNGKAGEKVSLDIGGAIDEVLTSLATVGVTGAVSSFLSAVLDIPIEKARLVPMTVARSVLIDFFMLNRSWLPLIQNSSSQNPLKTLMKR